MIFLYVFVYAEIVIAVLREVLKKEWAAKVILGLFLALSAWWAYLNFFFSREGGDSQYQLFAAVYGAMALWGGIWGIIISQKWGGLQSVMGRAALSLGLGLFAQEFGQLAYSYYIYFLQIEVPYPSVGDIGYFGSILFYIYGVYLLAKASGIKISLKSMKSKLQAIIIPVGMLAFSYYVFLQGYEFDWGNPLKVFLDFGYPLGQSFYISLAILSYLLSRKILGGMMRNRILVLLFALLVQYVADYTFLYQFSKGTWFVGGINDYTYLISYTIMALALLQLRVAWLKIRSEE